jgi:hypothetical protein
MSLSYHSLRSHFLRIIHDLLQPKKFFGKFFFAVAPFLNNSLLLVDPTLSGISLTLIPDFKPKIAETNFSAEQTLIQN